MKNLVHLYIGIYIYWHLYIGSPSMVVAGVSVHRYARLEGPLHKGTETWIQYLLGAKAKERP